ncbi:unnamed protein product [Haemonchus placei]|uniref:Uncharacterized protein n=1 Tax=Haemonchus placei TaxID=6290 RepID=A0A0N4W1T8_HAEPC|nr:unnamed protein product [Haemonchus placei]
MSLRLDAAGSDQKRRRSNGYKSPSSAEDERAALAMLRACTEKTTESSDKGGNGFEAEGKQPRGAQKNGFRRS